VLHQRRCHIHGKQLWQRVVLVVGLGALLCAVLAQVAFNQHSTLLDESSTDGGLINTDDGGDSLADSKVKEASKSRLAAKAQSLNKGGAHAAKKLKPLSPAQRKQVKERVKTIKAQIKAAEKKATAYDKQLLDKTATWRTQLIHAKTLRRDGDDFESEARMKVRKAAKDRKLAETYRRESEAAKRKFVAEEKPIEMAMKLEAHDQRAYRKMQLAIAEVCLNPSPPPSSQFPPLSQAARQVVGGVG